MIQWIFPLVTVVYFCDKKVSLCNWGLPQICDLVQAGHTLANSLPGAGITGLPHYACMPYKNKKFSKFIVHDMLAKHLDSLWHMIYVV